jgi:hypothetical protein
MIDGFRVRLSGNLPAKFVFDEHPNPPNVASGPVPSSITRSDLSRDGVVSDAFFETVSELIDQ